MRVVPVRLFCHANFSTQQKIIHGHQRLNLGLLQKSLKHLLKNCTKGGNPHSSKSRSFGGTARELEKKFAPLKKILLLFSSSNWEKMSVIKLRTLLLNFLVGNKWVISSRKCWVTPWICFRRLLISDGIASLFIHDWKWRWSPRQVIFKNWWVFCGTLFL